MSYSFEDLSDALLQNYKENSSVGSGSFLSGISGEQKLPAAVALVNSLKNKDMNSPDDTNRFLSKDSISNFSNASIGFDITSENEGILTQKMLKQHDILEAKNESKQYLKGFNVRENKIKEEVSEDEQDDEEMKLHE